MNYRAGLLVLLAWLAGGQSELAHAELDPEQVREAHQTIEVFKATNPRMQALFDKAWGYAVFPTVGKGGIGIGGAYGTGTVFEQGEPIGATRVLQFTIGFQLGGQSYSEVLFFENEQALENFQRGDLKLGAQASAVAVTAGASADAVFHEGIAVFTLVKGGLMYEASVGGQSFKYTPADGRPLPRRLSDNDNYLRGKQAFDDGDYGRAQSFWSEAAGEGDLQSLYELGKLYAEGLGVLRDLPRSHAYFNVAAARGHQPSVHARSVVEGNLDAGQRQQAERIAQDLYAALDAAGATTDVVDQK